jgi:hypothetical protein
MAISMKSNLPSNFSEEYDYFDTLSKKHDKTTSGNITWTSASSGVTYDQSLETDPLIVNKGETGFYYWFSIDILKDYIIDESYLDSVVDAVRDGSLLSATDDGASDAYAITLQVAPTAYALYQKFRFRANTANTGACTLNVNALGAKAIKDINGADLATGAIKALQIVEVIYDGTYFVMQSDTNYYNNRTFNTPTVINPIVQGAWDGWINPNQTWTYLATGTDAPTFTITVPSGAASKYSVGMRIKLTQTTVKYFIITAVADTVLTVYGGTDYTLTDAVITNNYYSPVKAPLGFPLNPAKWTMEITSAVLQAVNTPVAGTWKQAGSLQIDIPIGIWRIYFKGIGAVAFTGMAISCFVSLSTATNSETIGDLTAMASHNTGYSAAQILYVPFSTDYNLVLAAKTRYYAIMKSDQAATALQISGDQSKTVIRATCAYL